MSALANRQARWEFVRALKGAPASVLWALVLTERGYTGHELTVATGYSDKPIRRAVRRLADQGLIYQDGEARWRLAAASRRRLAAAVPSHNDPPSADRSNRLRALLSQMGIHPPALDRLAARTDLQAEPALARAWWWYVQTQSWAGNPPGLVIRRLEQGHPAPAGFLALARHWSKVSEADRRELRQQAWRAWRPEELAHAYRERYPQLTEAAFEAYLGLVKANPAVLGYQNNAR